MTQQSFTNQEHYGRTIVENRNVLDYSGQILTSVADNGVGAEVTRGFVQTDDSSLLDSGVYIGSCEGKMGSPMSMRNGGVSHDDEAITEQNGSHVDTVE